MNPNRTVHWTWKDGSPPEDVFPPWWRESWLEEGWRSRLWTDADMAEFVKDEFPELQDLMDSYASGIMRADAFRLLLLKRLGGLYVDLDFVKLKPLDWLPLPLPVPRKERVFFVTPFSGLLLPGILFWMALRSLCWPGPATGMLCM